MLLSKIYPVITYIHSRANRSEQNLFSNTLILFAFLCPILLSYYTRSDSQEQDSTTTTQKHRFLLKNARLWMVLWSETSLFNRTFAPQHGGGH